MSRSRAIDDEQVRTAVLDAAESLFYACGIQAVGMDSIRAEAGVSLKRLYGAFPGKESLVVAFLDRRDRRWHDSLRAHVMAEPDPRQRLLAIFDWLGEWFAEPGFRGCAWINAFGELGAVSVPVAARTVAHKSEFRRLVATLAADAGVDAPLGEHLYLLAEGAMVTAGIFATSEPAAQARVAAASLVQATVTGC